MGSSDTEELKRLVAQTLEAKGVLGKIKVCIIEMREKKGKRKERAEKERKKR